ncbi:MAG: copper transport protein, partial [Solirubrobacteraceae bacterium]|nr:copper transport protein [Solirubrobacteraceae bacterium]
MHRRHLPARVLATPLIPLAVLVALAAAAPAAHAHASLLGSSPPPGARVQSAAAPVTLRFSEPLNARLSNATLIDARSHRRVSSRSTASGRTIAVRPLAPLRRAAYRVEWHTVSTDDGHELEGSFGIGVGTAAAGGAHSVQQSPLADGGWLRALTRALLYVALLSFAGGLLLRALLERRQPSRSWLFPRGLDDHAGGLGVDANAVRARERALVSDLGLFAAALGAIAAVVEAARAAGGLSASALRDFLLANASGLARVAVVGFVLAALALARRRPTPAALAAACALGAVAVSGHANSADPRAVAIAADWVHLLAGATWLGGIGVIALVWGPALRRADAPTRTAIARHVLGAFGRVALPAFVVVALSGTASAVIELGRVSALWETTYGAILSAKIVLVALIALVAYAHARRLRPALLAANPHPPAGLERRHWRLVRSEPLLGIGVAAAVGVLAAFPLPPQQLDAVASAGASLTSCDGCPLPAPADDELAVAEQAGSHLVAAWIRRAPGALSGTVRVLDYRGQPASVGASIPGARRSSCGRGCLRFEIAGARSVLNVTLSERGRRYVAALPAEWQSGGAGLAREILDRAQATMRALRTVREREEVTSGPGTYARTDYTLRAPDRLTYATGGGVQGVSIGTRQWVRTPGSTWQEGNAPGGIAFRTSGWFRWTPYATGIQLLGARSGGGRGIAELALADPGTPVWTRLRVDLGSHRVLSERLVARSRFVSTRY